MNVHLHIAIPAIILRKLRGALAEVAAAAVGGALPDLVSAIEHVCYWIGAIDHLWSWRNQFHFIDQGALIAPAVVVVLCSFVSLALGADIKPIRFAAAFVFGYLLHIGVDYLWHDESGWRWWGVYVDIALTCGMIGYGIGQYLKHRKRYWEIYSGWNSYDETEWDCIKAFVRGL